MNYSVKVIKVNLSTGQADHLQQSTSMLMGREGRTTGRDHRRQISLDAGQIAKLSEPVSDTGESVMLDCDDLF